MIGIIDYEMGNLGSVSNACKFLGIESRVVTRPDETAACDAIVLPGVGAFGDCMDHLRSHGFVEVVNKWIEEDKPFLGICLGLQVLFESSEESPGVKGLGILPGAVRRFNLPKELKVPQIGWNRVRQKMPDCPLFKDVPDDVHFYFVHSFYADPSSDENTAGETEYGIAYTSTVWKGNMMAVQFHPEKSQKYGLQMLRNFTSWIAEGRRVS
ncbi:MAG: imidazole glycerol phosphate synthase subunit HisH [Verrucomicrobia bacterium]|nr:imidazole glycerol phosphate synthase subunit HisH [Verrucomicrobiota bacterium]